MAHWAELDKNDVVIRVTVGDNASPDEGYQWLIDNLGGRWMKTSRNTYGGIYYDPETGEPSADQSKAFRKNYASPGWTYDAKRDAFIPPKPEPVDGVEWVLNEQTCLWELPGSEG